MKFDELNTYVKDLSDNSIKANLNKKGIDLLDDYNKFINMLSEWVKDDAILNLLSVISAEEKGTSKFEIANRLDTITSGGKNNIDLNSFPVHDDDPIKDYIDI
jgi:hypothetical protein